MTLTCTNCNTRMDPTNPRGPCPCVTWDAAPPTDPLAELQAQHVTYWDCCSCMQPIAIRSGADVTTTYHHGVDSKGRETPMCRLYHPRCAPRENATSDTKRCLECGDVMQCTTKMPDSRWTRRKYCSVACRQKRQRAWNQREGAGSDRPNFS